MGNERILLRAAALLVAAWLSASPAAVLAQSANEDFFIAVANDRVDRVKQLLARGVDPNAVDRNGDPALVVAAREGNAATIDALLAAKADVNARNRFQDTALMVGALKGRLGIVKALRKRGAEIEGTGWTPLIYSATGGHDDLVRYLLAEGANVNAQSPNGTSALMMAVREAHSSTVALLLANRADVNHRNQNGASAIDWAKRNDDASMVALLRRAGARD